MMETGDTNKIMDGVAIQAEGGGRNEEIIAALLHFMRGQHSRLLGVAVLLRDKLKVVAGDVEDAAWRPIGERNRHPPFARQETDVAHRRIAEIPGEVSEVRSDASASPGAHQ